jgi:hypothetical protein
MHALGHAAGRLERECSFHVAIRAGRSQNANSRCWHLCLTFGGKNGCRRSLLRMLVAFDRFFQGTAPSGTVALPF